MTGDIFDQFAQRPELVDQLLSEMIYKEVYDETDALAWDARNRMMKHISTGDMQYVDYTMHPFLVEPRIEGFKPYAFIVVMKGRQGGWSEVFISGGLHHAAIKGSTHVVHAMQDKKQKEIFVQMKLNPIFAESPELYKLLRGSAKKSNKTKQRAENLTIKQFQNWSSYIVTYIKKDVVGTQEFRSIQGDVLGIDERADADETAIIPFEACADASKLQIVWHFGTPKLKYDEFHNLFLKSDQRNWLVICDDCNHENKLIDFHDWTTWDSHIMLDNAGNHYFGCDECGHEIDRRHGYWKPLNPEGLFRGYFSSQLIHQWIPAAKFKRLFATMTGSKRTEFIREKLGIPYSGEDVPLKEEWLLESLDPDRSYPENSRNRDEYMLTDHSFYGQDWGNISYKGYSQLHDDKLKIIDMWDVEEIDLTIQENIIHRDLGKIGSFMAVLDWGFGVGQNQRLMKKFPGRLWSCQGTGNLGKMIDWGTQTGKDSSKISWTVKINNTMIIEEVCALVKEGFFSFPGRTAQDVSKSRKIFEVMLRLVKEVKTMPEGKKVQYTTTKAHYFMVLIYMYLAYLRGGGGSSVQADSADIMEDIQGPPLQITPEFSNYDEIDVWSDRNPFRQH